MALAANALVTLAEAKDHLDILTSTIAIDARVERLVNVASQMIESYTDRKLIYQTASIRRDGRRSDRVLLPEYPVVAITALYDDPNWEFSAQTIIDPTEYYVEENSVLVLKGRAFSRANGNVRVDFSFGYRSPNGGVLGHERPSDLFYACLMTIEWLEKLRTDRRLGVQSKSKNGESISFSQELPAEIQMMLQEYRRYEMPNSDATTGNF
jgi:uncharacterized phiE125 gp8 family phage protein